LNPQLKQEATVLANYVLPKSKIKDHIANLYAAAVMHQGLPLKKNEKQVFTLMLKFPWLLTFVDSALAIIDPMSAIRHRIFIMLAILEVQPEYTHFFLAQDFKRYQALRVLGYCLRSGFCAAIGLFIWALIS